MFCVSFLYQSMPFLVFLVRIICGPIWGSLAVRDHLRSNLGIVCGPGSFAVLGSFADSYSCTDFLPRKANLQMGFLEATRCNYCQAGVAASFEQV